MFGEVSENPEDDPLEYLNSVIRGKEAFAKWRTDREWLNLAREHSMPTAVFSIARALTLAPKYTDPASLALSAKVQEKRKSEIPDFALFAYPGYAFRSDSPMESDHGGLSREEVRNSFFMSSLDEAQFKNHVELKTPVLSRDIMPTVLEYAGLKESLDATAELQGQSVKFMIER